MSNQHTVEYQETQAEELVKHATYLRDPSNENDIIAKLQDLHNSCPESHKIALYSAEALANELTLNFSQDNCMKLLDRLKILHETFPESVDIAHAFTKGLFPSVLLLKNISDKDQSLRHLIGLQESFPDSEYIANHLSLVLVEYKSKLDDVSERERSVSHLKKLQLAFPDSEFIGSILARGLIFQAMGQKDEAELSKIVDSMASLFERLHNSADIATNFALILKQLAFFQMKFDERMRTIDRIDSLRVSFPELVPIADELAFSLSSLTTSQLDEDFTELVLSRLTSLQQTFNTSENIALWLAMALGQVCVYQKDVDKKRKLISQVVKLSEIFPKSEKIAFQLVSLTSVELVKIPLAEMAPLLEKIVEIQKSFPESEEIGYHLGVALGNYSLVHINSARESKTFPEGCDLQNAIFQLDRVEHKFPESERIAIVLFRVLVNYLIILNSIDTKFQTIDQLVEIRQRFPGSQEMEELFTKSLEILISTTHSSEEEVDRTISKLTELFHANPQSHSVALYLAQGRSYRMQNYKGIQESNISLFDLLDRLGARMRDLETNVAELATIQQAFPHSVHIAIEYAAALAILMNERKNSLERNAETYHQLSDLQQSFPDNEELALKLAIGSTFLLIAGNRKHSTKFVRKLAKLQNTFPQSKMIAICLGLGLAQLVADPNNPKENELIVEWISELKQTFPDSEAISQQLANSQQIVNAHQSQFSDREKIKSSLAAFQQSFRTIVEEPDKETMVTIEQLASQNNIVTTPKTVEKLTDYRRSYPDSFAIALLLAKTLVSQALFTKNYVDRLLIIGQLTDLSQSFIGNRLLESEFAKGLLILMSGQSDAKGGGKILSKLAEFKNTKSDSPEFVMFSDLGHIILTNKLNAKQNINRTLTDLTAVLQRDSVTQEIGNLIARILVDLTANPISSQEKAQIIDQITKLHRTFPDSSEILHLQASIDAKEPKKFFKFWK